MTREQVLKLFPEATEEQITNLLNQSNAELEKEKTKAKAYKADADKAKELQAKIDELETGNLTEIEKAMVSSTALILLPSRSAPRSEPDNS